MVNAVAALSLLSGNAITTASSSTGASVSNILSRAEIPRVTPWDDRLPSIPASALASATLGASSIIDTSLGRGAGSGVRDPDDRSLFVLHEATRKLNALAEAASNERVPVSDRKRFAARFEKGLAELNEFIAKADLSRSIIVSGKKVDAARSSSLGRPSTTYVGQPIWRGALTEPVDAFQGDRRFTISVTKLGTTTDISVDLAELGSTPRTFAAVNGLINDKLAAAGYTTKFSTATITEPGRPAGAKSYGFQIERTQLETVTLRGVADDTRPTLYLAGSQSVTERTAATPGAPSVSTTTTSGLVAKYTGLEAGDPTQAFEKTISAKDAAASARAITQGPDGSLYVVGNATGTVDGLTPKGESDVFITKYDSTGKAVWTRLLGSAAPADGFSVAVGADGTVAVTGTVAGKVDATASGGGKDSFVAAFDDEGRDLFFVQRGSALDDSASSVAVADDGTILIAGTTRGTLGGAVVAGGSDAYVQALSATGTALWTKTIGTAGNETGDALVVEGSNVYLALSGTSGGSLTRLDVATGTADGAFNFTGNDLGLSRIAAIAVRDGVLVATGAASDAPTDAIVARIDTNAGSLTGTTRLNDFGSATAVAVAGGQIVVAGNARTPFGSAATGVLTGLDATTGSALWTEAVAGKPGATKDGVTTSPASVSISGIVLAPTESRSLSALGLPEGDLKLGDVTNITDRTALRAGDWFELSVDDGPARRITITQGETFRSLVTKINRAIGGAGTAETFRSLSGDRLNINPSRGRSIELIPGDGTADALAQLGLNPGIAIVQDKRDLARDASADNPRIIALEIPAGLNLDTAADARRAKSSLDAIMARIRNGYRETSRSLEAREFRLEQKLSGAARGVSGAGNAYINSQIANYQAGLARLGGTVA